MKKFIIYVRSVKQLRKMNEKQIKNLSERLEGWLVWFLGAIIFIIFVGALILKG